MSQRKSSIHNYHDINTQLFTHSPLTYQSEVWSSQFTQIKSKCTWLYITVILCHDFATGIRDPGTPCLHTRL